MKQKWGIALVSALIWVGAAITLLGAAASIFMGSTLASLGFNIGLVDVTTYLTTVAWVGIIVAVLYIMLGYFLWIHNSYAWYITFIFAVLGMLSVIAGFTISPVAFLGVLLAVVEILALTNRDSMDACKVKLVDWKGWG